MNQHKRMPQLSYLDDGRYLIAQVQQALAAADHGTAHAVEHLATQLARLAAQRGRQTTQVTLVRQPEPEGKP